MEISESKLTETMNNLTESIMQRVYLELPHIVMQHLKRMTSYQKMLTEMKLDTPELNTHMPEIASIANDVQSNDLSLDDATVLKQAIKLFKSQKDLTEVSNDQGF